ncbi:uncharacterized protein B0T15DRAFT_46572 [Chaetomium strumarium]|uniref:Uncharacterized protein n=1 Tax=Chaetomium strumarium TaxID=1170767 RepID=A0AAJ0H2M0_9PEZI|nr:hypothetical protein B0T15DRAFT_46572 [Chaetomium strumarium]
MSRRSKCSGNQRVKSGIVVSRPKHISMAHPVAQMHQTSELKTSLELDHPQDSAKKADSIQWAPTARAPTRELQRIASHPLPATPPPDSNFEAASHFIDGVGCHFPAMLPSSRAESLTMESESATQTRATHRAASAPPRSSDTGCTFVLGDTHRFGFPSPGAPAWSFWFRDPFGPVYPLTPGLNPDRKRTSSPPVTPRPTKQAKTEAHQAYEGTQDGLCREGSFSCDNATPSLWHARQLTINLAEAAAYPVASLEVGQGSFADAMSSAHTTAWSRQSGHAHEVPHCPSFISPETSQANGAFGLTRWNNNPRYAIEAQCFSEDEISERLAQLLTAYRAFYLEPDEAQPPRPRDADRARRSRHILRTIFAHQLNSAGGEEFLLQEEEEDILDAFLLWIREKQTASALDRKAFDNLPECLEHFNTLVLSPFVRYIM